MPYKGDYSGTCQGGCTVVDDARFTRDVGEAPARSGGGQCKAPRTGGDRIACAANHQDGM